MIRLTLGAMVVLLCWIAEVKANGAPIPFIDFVPDILERKAEMIIEVDEKTKDIHLVIPKDLLPRPIPQQQPEKRGAAAGGIPLIVTGIALTCAFVSAGMWLVGRGRGRMLAGILLVTALVAVGTTITANLLPIKRPAPQVVKENTTSLQPQGQEIDDWYGPWYLTWPGNKENTTPEPSPANVLFSGKVVLQIVPKGDKVRLVLPRSGFVSTIVGENED